MYFRLPDALSATLFLLAIAVAIASPVLDPATAVLSAVIGFCAFWLLRWGYFKWRGREGLGLGDVKLMAAIGALVGWQMIAVVTLIAALMALAVALISKIRGEISDFKSTKLPFGSYLCAATVLVLVM